MLGAAFLLAVAFSFAYGAKASNTECCAANASESTCCGVPCSDPTQCPIPCCKAEAPKEEVQK